MVERKKMQPRSNEEHEAKKGRGALRYRIQEKVFPLEPAKRVAGIEPRVKA